MSPSGSSSYDNYANEKKKAMIVFRRLFMSFHLCTHAVEYPKDWNKISCIEKKRILWAGKRRRRRRRNVSVRKGRCCDSHNTDHTKLRSLSSCWKTSCDINACMDLHCSIFYKSACFYCYRCHYWWTKTWKLRSWIGEKRRRLQRPCGGSQWALLFE